jgi:hypothetical protein
MAAVAAAVALAACGSDSNGTPAPAPGPQACTPPATAKAPFEAQVHPILQSKCASCHGTAWGSADRTTAYNAARAQVDPSNVPSVAEGSALVEKGTGAVSHGGGVRLDPAEATSVVTWIEECAQNN